MKILFGSILLLLLVVSAQAVGDDKSCMEKVIAYEDKILNQNWKELVKPTYINYQLWSIDWDDAVIDTDVKLYRNKDNMHLFSELANFYMDEKEAFVVLKKQRMIIATNSSENIMNVNLGSDFLAFRKLFLQNCDIAYCTIVDSVKSIQQIKLVPNEDFIGLVDINSMVYRYDKKNNKLLSTIVAYDKSYKLKKMKIIYKDFKENCGYTFQKSSKYVLSGPHKLSTEFNGFEFIDEREKSKENK